MKVYSYPNTHSKNGLRLELDLLHFEEDQEGMAHVAARWRIMSDTEQTILHTRTSQYRIEPETRDYDGLVQGLSQGMNRLSQEVSAKILQLTSSNDRN